MMILTSTLVDAPPERVWALLRDFAAIGDWHPFLPSVRIENGPADRVGSVRVFPEAGGHDSGGHRERLVALDDRARRIEFAFEDTAGLPVRDYVSAMRVEPVDDGRRTFVAWSATFDCDAADVDKVIGQVRDGIFNPGLAALGQRFRPEA